MAPAVRDPLAYVLGRAQRVLGPGVGAEDCAVRVVTRFLIGDEPSWLARRPETVRLDVLTAADIVASRRS